ncbi:hypothetical protein Ccrd_004707 [Cynara cardunculus var. scolymus]|uniref:Uncharacterized protein n=1 Tax=Cynara cardunculus var. scolymus TaxID=59895 RepID=A0A103XM19_CYNCS|nr:hypothetical protein Ccrd_004707 [Cynara cardunculus var. scolymus]
MGAHVSKKSVIVSSTHRFSSELNSYEAACRSDVELQSFDMILQARANHVITTLATGVQTLYAG